MIVGCTPSEAATKPVTDKAPRSTVASNPFPVALSRRMRNALHEDVVFGLQVQDRVLGRFLRDTVTNRTLSGSLRSLRTVATAVPISSALKGSSGCRGTAQPFERHRSVTRSCLPFRRWPGGRQTKTVTKPAVASTRTLDLAVVMATPTELASHFTFPRGRIYPTPSGGSIRRPHSGQETDEVALLVTNSEQG